MIRVENSERDRCFCCDGRDDVMDVVLETEGKDLAQHRMSLCIGCRSELHDELTSDDSGESRPVVRELDW